MSFKKVSSLRASSPIVLRRVLPVLTWQVAFFFWTNLQFDVICQDLWEDCAETSPERAVENRAEHHRENNCSASAEWPECEFDCWLPVSSFFHLSADHLLPSSFSLNINTHWVAMSYSSVRSGFTLCIILLSVCACVQSIGFVSLKFQIFFLLLPHLTNSAIKWFSPFSSSIAYYVHAVIFVFACLSNESLNLIFRVHVLLWKMSVSQTARGSDDLQCRQGLGTAVQTEGNSEMSPWSLLLTWLPVSSQRWNLIWELPFDSKGISLCLANLSSQY